MTLSPLSGLPIRSCFPMAGNRRDRRVLSRRCGMYQPTERKRQSRSSEPSARNCCAGSDAGLLFSQKATGRQKLLLIKRACNAPPSWRGHCAARFHSALHLAQTRASPRRPGLPHAVSPVITAGCKAGGSSGGREKTRGQRRVSDDCGCDFKNRFGLRCGRLAAREPAGKPATGPASMAPTFEP
jgi:hypothetical protein